MLALVLLTHYLHEGRARKMSRTRKVRSWQRWTRPICRQSSPMPSGRLASSASQRTRVFGPPESIKEWNTQITELLISPFTQQGVRGRIGNSAHRGARHEGGHASSWRQRLLASACDHGYVSGEEDVRGDGPKTFCSHLGAGPAASAGNRSAGGTVRLQDLVT
jgi:hypothetical protein